MRSTLSTGALALLPLFQLLLHIRPLAANLESGASFFGDGYVEVPLVSTISTIQLHVQFYTSQRSGLLFLAAGRMDYLLLELRAGVLQARMDLGSEELTVKSPAGPHLNNLVIHDADLLVADGRMTLIVDGFFNASVEIPGPQKQLDIDYGLYVGGTGSLELPYLTGASLPFRGCLHAVTFNDRDVFSALASGTSTKRSHGVQAGCSVEFSAGPDDPFGFLGPNSYITFPGWSARNEGTIEFVISTSVKQAPLIYQSGLDNDFFYLEISDGRLRGVVEKGNGLVVLHNNIYLSNERDHYVKVHMDVRKFEILVDYYASQTSNKGMHSYLDLQGPLFIGGLNEKAAHRMRERGLAFMSADSLSNSSFVGCIEDLRVNQEKRSLQNALVTRGITAGCGKLEQYGDYEDAYEQDEAPTSPPPDNWQEPLMEPCRPDPSLPLVFANFTKLLHVSPLVVAEGGTAFLEWRHTQPTIDLGSANIRQSQVLFSVTTDPRHGQLELDIARIRSRRKFTLLDIVNRKVKYVHDGSEGPMDQLLLEVTVTARKGIPECLWQGQIYLLPIKINPVNDAPEVVFPHGDRMVILEHTRKHLNTDIIQVNDDDTPCDSLQFQLLGGKKMEEGYVEYDFHPGVPIEEFSCRDLEAGKVVYVHQNGLTSTLTVQVNDGMVMSPVASLRVVAVEPDIQVRNNTGLFASQGEAVPITTANLSVETNAVQQKVPILYHLTVPLQYGQIQKQGSLGGEWKRVESFYQQDIEQGRIQYFSTDAEHHTEDVIEKLQFVVQVGQKTLRNNTFLIRIKRATITMRTMVPLQMKNEKKRNITTAELEAVLEEPSFSPASFHYVIIQPPKKGNLELQGIRLTEGFGFTQEDLQNHQLSYSATIRESKETEDFFLFRVTSEAHYSPVYTYTIRIGGDPDAPILTNVLLSVGEGEQAVISKDHLFVKSMNSMEYVYDVFEGPSHGKLILRTPENLPAGKEVIKFTNEDILQGHLVYKHDGSEALEDDIPFVAMRQDEGSSDLEGGAMRGVFRVSIQPRNDHAPVQVVNKVFNVVRNGQRLMTTDDIAFFDEDSGFSDAQIVLGRKDILFGSIIAVENRSRQVYRFTQDDLRKKKILFVHSGADRGWIHFQVSDGLYQTAALLEVQASDPYLTVNNYTALEVHQGSQGTINSSVLSVETNMDIRNEEDILFHIVSPPKWGMVLRGGREVSSFTQKDLLAGEVLYHHNGSRNSQDTIQLSVEANHVIVEATLKVEISLVSHPGPLNIIHHEKIHILQGEAVEIKNDYLLIEHEDLLPDEITYTVTVPPLSGFLVALFHGPISDEPPSLDPIETFTQEDINRGKILYLHSSPEIQSDQFTVDITANGVEPLKGFVVPLEILPISVPLEVHNFTVTEGSTQALSVDVLNIPSTHFTYLHVEFDILEPPQHGIFQNMEGPKEDSLLGFSWHEVEQRLIQYVHDGSETLADRFTVVANVSGVNQQSQPKTVYINIIPSNDEAPVLVVNVGLQVPEGGTAEITSELLRGEDEDTPPEEVVYSIRTPVNGKVVLKSSPGNVVQRVTQAQINSRLVEFVHEGSLNGGFSFDLSDGENMSPGHFFTVTAQKKLFISLESKKNLTVCPGSSQPITSQNLKAVANHEAEAQSLLYIIEQPPEFGKLENSQKDNDGGELRNFTQAEIDSGVIIFQHQMPLDPFWILQDTLHFRISSPSMITDPDILGVLISFETGCPQRATKLWKNNGLTVPEARSVVIDTSVLDASNLLTKEPESERASYDVIFLVTELPSQGTLSVPDGPVNRKHPYFLQSDLAAGGLEYSHHGSGTLNDHFKFSAWVRHSSMESIQPPQTGEEPVLSGIFNVTISDSNEMPPRLVSPGHVLQVLHDSPVMLTQEHLHVIDPDSSPEEIKYDILSRSSGGFVANIHDKQVPVIQFTQADINAGHLMFITNGTTSPGTLDFTISDGHNPSIFTSLEIMILPATTWATNQRPVEIPQGTNIVSLSQDHLLGDSGPGGPNTLYRLIKDPLFGQVRVNGEPVREFSQKQVDNGEVTFGFTDFVSSKDEFQFLATSGGVNISGMVNITVKTLVKTQQGILWPRGTTVLLGTNILDASELANRTESIPVFRILRAPQGSQFVKVSRDNRNQPISIDAFTQHELERGLVGLEIWEAEDSEQSLHHDSFLFELAAEGVPPALDSMEYTTEAFNASVPYGATFLKVPNLQDRTPSPTFQSTTPSSQTLTSRPQESEEASQNSSEPHVLPTVWLGQGLTANVSPTERSTLLNFIEANMFSIILPICLILLLLALILPLLFYLHKRNKTGKHNVQGTPPKYKNGTVVDQETFRKTDPNQTIPLMTVNSLEDKGAGPNSKGAGPGGQQDPELLQYCRTSNPALKNSQYWV